VATSNFFVQLNDAEESGIMPDLFGDDDMYPAMEGLDDDLDRLGQVDGSAEAEAEASADAETEADTTESEEPAEDDVGEEAPDDEGGETEDLAAATDEQLEEDGEAVDTSATPDDEGGDLDTNDDSSDTDLTNTASDPLRSVAVKEAYRTKFLKLYTIIIDSVTTMNTFTPEYTNSESKKYYRLREQLNELKELIYIICTKKLSAMTVDEVLRKYSLCNMTYDAITNEMKEFIEAYNRQQKKAQTKDRSERAKEGARRIASSLNYESISKRPNTTK